MWVGGGRGDWVGDWMQAGVERIYSEGFQLQTNSFNETSEKQMFAHKSEGVLIFHKKSFYTEISKNFKALLKLDKHC